MSDIHLTGGPDFLNPDGSLKIVTWAQQELSPYWASDGIIDFLTVSTSPRPHPMAHSPATGQPLVSNGSLGADLIRLAAGDGFVPHTHPGDHLLIVVAGLGTITYDGKIYPTRAGQIYMLEGAIPHAVGAVTDHVIMSVGHPHRPVGSPERMTVVEYQEVIALTGELHCLICDKAAAYPAYLHDEACPHCPCPECCPEAGGAGHHAG